MQAQAQKRRRVAAPRKPPQKKEQASSNDDPESLSPLAPSNPGDVRVRIKDEGKVTTRFVPWAQWPSVIRDAGLQLLHTMPVTFNPAGTVMTLYPALECDSRHVAGSDVSVEVTLPTTTAVLSTTSATTTAAI